MAMVNVEPFPPAQMVRSLSENLTALLPHLSLKLLKSAAAHANLRLHAVQAEVLVLASGKDNMLPSEDEAKRLSSLLKNCKVHNFKDNGHTLLLVGCLI
ncbi:mRNA-binding ribosome synthesis protein [Ancistrocladus abbreviatus]